MLVDENDNGFVKVSHAKEAKLQSMELMRFNRQLYSKTALLKAAYNYTDTAYVHLDVDDKYYYVSIESKSTEKAVSEKEFKNEMLAQSVRHEIYLQTKNIRELLLARSLATSVVADQPGDQSEEADVTFSEDEILRDWFEENG